MIKKFYRFFGVTAFVFLACVMAQAQQLQVSGTLTDESGATMPGVNILLKGTTIGTSTGTNGKFVFNATPEDVLVVSFIGFTTKEIPSFVGEGKPGLRFSSFIPFTPVESSILNKTISL